MCCYILERGRQKFPLRLSPKLRRSCSPSISPSYRSHKNNQFRPALVMLLHSSGNTGELRSPGQTGASAPTRNQRADLKQKFLGQEGRHGGPEERVGICEAKRRQDSRLAFYGSARVMASHLLPD